MGPERYDFCENFPIKEIPSSQKLLYKKVEVLLKAPCVEASTVIRVSCVYEDNSLSIRR
jgi:hypothetical protein